MIKNPIAIDNKQLQTVAEFGDEFLTVKNGSFVDEGFKGVDEVPVSGVVKNESGDLIKNPRLVVKEDGSTAFKGIAIPKGVRTTKLLQEVSDAVEITVRVKELRGQLTSGLKRRGNFGWAQTDVDGLNKSEYFAHSRVNTPEESQTVFERLPNISPKPDNFNFNPFEVDGYLRDIDTEFKILEDIAKRLKDNPNASGIIRLFTEKPPCTSCSGIINQFMDKFE